MIRISDEDALRALRKFKRLAKQDILASPHTDNPQFWQMQAEARRAQYSELIDIITKDGVDVAFQQIVGKKSRTSRFSFADEGNTDPVPHGRQQAREMFLTMMGVPRQRQSRR